MNTSSTSIIRRLARPLSITGGAALASSAQAALVQIDFIGNDITANGDQLFADMDADGTDDLTFTDTLVVVNAFTNSGISYTYLAGGVNINGAGNNLGFASISSLTFLFSSGLSFAGAPLLGGTSRGFIQAEFTNSALGVHQGFLEVVVQSGSTPGDNGVSIVRFIYDDASATLDESTIDINTQYTSIGETSATGTTIVPEPSSLGLLALGAGGLALRRRRKTA